MKFKAHMRKLVGTASIAFDVMWSEWDFQIDIAILFWQLELCWSKD